MTYTYSQYRYENGSHRNEKWNKEIISIARRHKFYMGQVKAIVNGECWGTQNHQIIVCLKKEKVVGFVIYEPNHMWNRGGARMVNNMMYWCVDSKHRGNGCGKRLYEMMIDDCDYFEIKNQAVEFKKDDEKLATLYTKLGYSYVPIYDGIEQKGGDNHHIKWNKVICPQYTLPVMCAFGDDTPSILDLLREN